MMPLESLLRAARDNQPGAWQRLVPHLQSALYEFCLTRLSVDDAQEVTQRTIVAVSTLLPTLEDLRSLEGWTFGVARNLILHEIRDSSRRVARHEAAAHHFMAALCTELSTRYGQAEIWQIVCEEIRRLPTHFRVVIEHDLADGDAEEFVTRHGISRETMRTHRHRARKLLAKLVKARLEAAEVRSPSST